MSKKEDPRPVGWINIHDPRGYSFLPKILRRELNVEGKGRIPFYLDANVVVLVRKNAKRTEILKGLELLKEDLKLRWQGRDAESE